MAGGQSRAVCIGMPTGSMHLRQTMIAVQVDDRETSFSVSGQQVTRCVDVMLVYITGKDNKVLLGLHVTFACAVLTGNVQQQSKVACVCGTGHNF